MHPSVNVNVNVNVIVCDMAQAQRALTVPAFSAVQKLPAKAPIAHW